MAQHTIDEFMNKIGRQKGMSLTTGFDVFFGFPSSHAMLQRYYTGGDDDVVHMLCDEAQLPNVQTATGQLSGRYVGESGVQYPHSRMFTDVGLGFLCDAKLTPLKFFNWWYQWMFNEEHVTSENDLKKAKASSPQDRNRINRVRYQDEYAALIRIIKTEPNKNAANGRAPITYILENAYPYAIDAVPLSYGSSQLTRVNVNFHYSRHTVIYGDGEVTSTSDVFAGFDALYPRDPNEVTINDFQQN